jgi:hypothetical protein
MSFERMIETADEVINEATRKVNEVFNAMNRVKRIAVEQNADDDSTIVCSAFNLFQIYKKNNTNLDIKTHWKTVFDAFVGLEQLLRRGKIVCNLINSANKKNMKFGNCNVTDDQINTFLKLEKETRDYRSKMLCIHSNFSADLEQNYKLFTDANGF